MNKVIIISCVVIGLFAVILALMEIGRRIGRRRKSQDPRGATAGLSAIDGAVCGFMGRFVAFASREQPPVSMREDSELVRKQMLSGRPTFGLTCCRRQNGQCCETASGTTFWLDSDRYRRPCLDGHPQQHEALLAVNANLSTRRRGLNGSSATTQSDAAKPVALAESAEDNFVSILQKFSLLSAGQGNRILAA
jgi:hypothetical protein